MPKRYSQLLFRLVNYFKPGNILELGTSLGITTCYLASALTENKIITIEGCENTSKIAEENFKKLRLSNIEMLNGEFSGTIPLALEKISSPDFVLFDGNHRKEATLEYYKTIVKKHKADSVFIFDDIHWSREMNEAWNIIRNDSPVSLTIDLYRFGIVFFKKGIHKQNFVLKF